MIYDIRATWVSVPGITNCSDLVRRFTFKSAAEGDTFINHFVSGRKRSLKVVLIPSTLDGVSYETLRHEVNDLLATGIE